MAYDSNHAKLWQDVKADLDKLRARTGKFAADAEWAFGSRTARVLGVLVLFAVVVTLLLVFLNWYVAPTKPSDKKDLVLALAQILAGTALLSGLYFTWRTLQVNREGQITDRFTRAIDQLGATDNEGDKLFEIRIGGIYALERIAKESEEDYWSIMEILTAYVRHNSHWPHGQIRSSQDVRELVERGPNRVEPDIEAIMTVLRRRAGSYGSGEPQHLNLSDTNLAGVNLMEANLSYAYLPGAYLFEANLWRAVLFNAKLWNARLYRANLTGKASLIGADLTGAQLWWAKLKEAILIGAILEKAEFWRADLSEANLGLANLEGADLTRADLSGANLGSAKTSTRQDSKGRILRERTLPSRTSPKSSWKRQQETRRPLDSQTASSLPHTGREDRRTTRGGLRAHANFAESPKGEVRRILIPRTSVNKGEKKGRDS